MTNQFRPENSALVLIDHQIGTLQLVKTLNPADVERLVVALAKTAKALNMPVILTTSVETGFQQPMIKSLAEALPEDYPARIRRQGIVNAWNDPDFKAAVEKTARRQLIMAAVTTDICLVYPAISAVADGYEVQAVLDASGSPTELSEDMARRRMEAAGVILTATNTLIAELAQDWSTPEGKQLAAIMSAYVSPSVHMLAASEGAPI